MFKRKLTALMLVAVLVSACTDSDRKKIAQASDDLARGISAALTLDDALIKGNLISKDDAIGITGAILDVNRLATQLNTRAQLYKTGDPAGKAALLKIVNDMVAAVGELNKTGTLHIKNPSAQAQLQAALAVMQGALAVLSGVLGGAK